MDHTATDDRGIATPSGPDPKTTPLLFQRREYVDAAEASTTTCVSSTTSPVKEYTPDD